MLATVLATAGACSRTNPAYLEPLGNDASTPKDNAAAGDLVADAGELPDLMDMVPMTDIGPDGGRDLAPGLAPDLPPGTPPRVMIGASSPTPKRGGNGYYTTTDQCAANEAVVG